MKKILAWFGAMRLWSLTASLIPIALGAVLAARDGRFSWSMFGLTLLCGCLLQIAANLINLHGDFQSGVDRPGTCPSCPQLVEGRLTPRAVKIAGLLSLALAALVAAVILRRAEPTLIPFALAGVAGAWGYTAGPRFKYAGLGVPGVFLLMGVLMTTASYLAQTGKISTDILLASLPVGCLVAAILHGNDLRDTASDRQADIRTTTLILGLNRARQLYVLLTLLPFVLVLAGVLAGRFTPWTLLVLPALIPARQLLRVCATGFRTNDIAALRTLEGRSASLHFLFGLLFVAGFAIGLCMKDQNT